MAVVNQFLNDQVYANTMLLLLKNQLVYGRLVDGQFSNQVTDRNNLTISVKRPPEFITNSGAALAEQDILTGSATVAVNQYKNVHVSVGDLERVQSFNDLMASSVMKSAASALAHDIDAFLAEKTLEFSTTAFQVPGTPAFDAIQSPAQFNKVHTALMENGVPNSDLNAVIDFESAELIRGSLIGGNIQGTNRTALERTRVPLLSEIDVYGTQQVPVYTTGTRTASGAVTVSGANQSVTYRSSNTTMSQNLTLTGGVPGAGWTYKRGDTFTIANVNAYDPRAKRSTGKLRRFVVLADATADGAGAVTLSISPAIIVPTGDTGKDAPYATVNAVPANGAAVTFDGAASTALTVRSAFHKSAIALVSAQLAAPFEGRYSFATDPETGVSIRYWRGSDIATGKHIHRWDMIYGATVVDRRLGARVYGDAP